MGFFSWLTCDTNKSIRCGGQINLLYPDNTIETDECYDGYGTVNGKDLYYLNLMWNRQHILKNYDPKVLKDLCEKKFLLKNVSTAKFLDSSIPDSYFYENMSEFERKLRVLMIEICYSTDENIQSMNKYPLKFVENIKNNDYFKYQGAESDPTQGYF